jgi:hypothetical protein
VAVTYDGNSMKIYIDGVLSAQNNITLTIGNANNSNLLIGESPGFPGRVFNGKIDEVRVWNVARAQTQIQSTMNTILTEEYYSSPYSGLVGYWRLDEGTGQSAQDLSFYSNNATLGTSANPDVSDPSWVQANILIVNLDDEKNSPSIPIRFSLSQNYPNPFNPVTKIKYTVPSVILSGAKNLTVQLKVYDVLGNEIAALVNEEKSAGIYEVDFDGSKLSSGVYFYQLSAGNFINTKKMILIK